MTVITRLASTSAIRKTGWTKSSPVTASQNNMCVKRFSAVMAASPCPRFRNGTANECLAPKTLACTMMGGAERCVQKLRSCQVVKDR